MDAQGIGDDRGWDLGDEVAERGDACLADREAEFAQAVPGLLGNRLAGVAAGEQPAGVAGGRGKFTQ